MLKKYTGSAQHIDHQPLLVQSGTFFGFIIQIIRFLCLTLTLFVTNSSALEIGGILKESFRNANNAMVGSYTHLKFPSWGNRTHLGNDVLADCGQPIYAPGYGVVVDVVSSLTTNFNSFGNAVIIRHPFGGIDGRDIFSLFLHMQETPLVQVGNTVTRDVQIGAIGTTGSANGICHSHVELRYFQARFSTDWSPGNIYAPTDINSESYAINHWENPNSFALRNGLIFSPNAFEGILKNNGNLTIVSSGLYNSPGKIDLYNGVLNPESPYLPYLANIVIHSGNWVANGSTTNININLFNPFSNGNTGAASGFPVIDDKFIYPIHVVVSGAADVVTGIAPLLGEGYYPFNDVQPNYWASCYIMKLWRNGIANGDNGLFHPFSEITRAEFLKMVLNAARGLGNFTSTSINSFPVTYFKDRDFASWQHVYVNYAIQNNIVSGGYCLGSLTDRCFFPNAPITRSEAVAILVRAFDLKSNPAISNSFPDAQAALYPNVYVAASNTGNSGCGGGDEPIISGFKDGTFGPNAKLLRDQAAKIIAVAMKK